MLTSIKHDSLLLLHHGMNDHSKKFYVANPNVLGCSRTGLRIKL